MNDLRMSTSLYRETTDNGFKNNINKFVNHCYIQSKEAGWHDKQREIGTMLMLIVSEISEAMEGDRKDLMDDHLPHRKMIEVELADAMIRIGDLAGKLNLDLGGAIDEKLKFNKNRPDHKMENRALDGGKNTKLEIQDINISKLPVVVNAIDNKTTITVSAGTKIFFTNNEGDTEALMPVVNFKYQENNNYITSI